MQVSNNIYHIYRNQYQRELQRDDCPGWTCVQNCLLYMTISSEVVSSIKPLLYHDDVIKWKKFPRYQPFVRGIHRSQANSPHKDQWRGALMFSLIGAWINASVNNRDADDLRRHRAHYDVIVMICNFSGGSSHKVQANPTSYLHCDYVTIPLPDVFLTHWGRVTHICIISLGSIGSNKWIVTCSAPMSNYCKLDPYEQTWFKLYLKFSNIFIQENAFKISSGK